MVHWYLTILFIIVRFIRYLWLPGSKEIPVGTRHISKKENLKGVTLNKKGNKLKKKVVKQTSATKYDVWKHWDVDLTRTRLYALCTIKRRNVSQLLRFVNWYKYDFFLTSERTTDYWDHFNWMITFNMANVYLLYVTSRKL